VGMPGFHGQGSRDFDFSAGSVQGYRWWCLDAPDLQGVPPDGDEGWFPGPLRGQTGHTWKPGVNEAFCIYHASHAPPVEADDETGHACGCGFWGYWEPPEVPHFHSGALWLLGVFRGTGRTLIGTEGFRCQRAQIIALHLASGFQLVVPAGRSDWIRQWGQVFSQPGTHRPPHGRPAVTGPAEPITGEQQAASGDRMRAWQAVIEDRLALMYPDARIVTVRRALLTLFPPSRDSMNV
jgi:hypothetical protein